MVIHKCPPITCLQCVLILFKTSIALNPLTGMLPKAFSTINENQSSSPVQE
jgi:hypothetical protein